MDDENSTTATAETTATKEDLVFQGEDKFWRVRGLPAETYYQDEETARRVARQLGHDADQVNE